ncbi:hypothetical protein HJC23_012044 [Cyclotella cryptica]|uniref:GPI-anchored wall transfer protein n=1 Tax=Cyclotella cryptica TaxID=29204 RepID=A0ABD3PRK2_9STRA|eukprot:CCRYP_012352-RA/>CCRYP_012352-RA protein AED:0.00 eAED:0.00 QI:66/-1/1/1/-1/1/1/88/494
MTTNDEAPTRKYHDKEAFVTGHSGTTPLEILLVCAVIPVGLHLYLKLLPFVAKKFHRPFVIDLLEFMTLILPALLVQTSLLPYISGHVRLLLGMLLLSSIVPDQNRKTQTGGNTDAKETKRPAFLTIHRSSVYILTTVAILAVDFPIFPRRYCKTEISGYGWMDLGAASFVIIAGWTSSLITSFPAKNSRGKSSSLSYKAIKKFTPLFLLGIIRLFTNKGLEYQEHVSEYGVHWNFFFTLCFIEVFLLGWRPVKALFRLCRKSIPFDGIMGVMMIVLYQSFLSMYGGQDFIENGDRRCTTKYGESWTMCDVFFANREGIFGLFGYLSLRLLSEEIGRFCLLPTQQHSVKDPSNIRTSAQRDQRILLTTLLLWLLHSTFTISLQIPTSRRSTNVSFVSWALSHNMTVLYLIHYVTASFSPCHDDEPPPTPHVLHAVNRFGLAVFLLSNILTGLVNLSLDTLHASDGRAMLVLSTYVGLICGSALLLDRFPISNKK